MQHYLLVGYVIIYCIVAIFFFIAYAQIVPDEQKKTDKPWETPLDLVLIVVGLAGMLFLLSDLKSDTLKFIWRPVSMALAATQLYLNLKGRLEMFRSGEARKGDVEVGHVDILTILFLLPSICLNIYYAFR